MSEPPALPVLEHAVIVPAGGLFTFDEIVVLGRLADIALEKRGTVDPKTTLLVRRLHAMGEAFSLTSRSGSDSRLVDLGGSRSGTSVARPTPIMSAKEVADELGCSVRWVNNLAATDVLPARKIGRSWMFARNDVERFMDERNGDPGEPST